MIAAARVSQHQRYRMLRAEIQHTSNSAGTYGKIKQTSITSREENEGVRQADHTIKTDGPAQTKGADKEGEDMFKHDSEPVR